jgi:curved DNA-binding protein CbpA
VIDHYKVLGLARSANPEEIKSAYRRQAKVHHPDRNGGRDEFFKKVNEAYETLSDPVKKSIYDDSVARFLRQKKPSRPAPAQPGRPQTRPARRPFFKNEEEKWAWIAAHDPNMGNVQDVVPQTELNEAPKSRRKRDWVDAFFDEYERATNHPNIR